MNYILLSLRKRFDDYETFGVLFRAVKELILEQTLAKKIWIFFIEITTKLCNNLSIDFDVFMSNLIQNYHQVMKDLKNSFSIIFSINKQESTIFS